MLTDHGNTRCPAFTRSCVVLPVSTALYSAASMEPSPLLPAT